MIVPTRPLRLSSRRKAVLVDEAVVEELLARIRAAGKTVWPRDIKLAARAVREGKRAVLLAGGSVVYVTGPPQAAGR